MGCRVRVEAQLKILNVNLTRGDPRTGVQGTPGLL